MRSSEKVRLTVFLLFFVILVCFGVLYRPTNAMSHPPDLATKQTAKNQ